ncbi:MAG: hypothetical protein QOI20_3256 [Acidimicrobiaceae bacterium]|jgi:hypothetical protein|nr:hypothetical protein [Acidimicrobiaceae bacterium]
MSAPAGAIVSLYVDVVAIVKPTDVIETRSGRRYEVLTVRVQLRGKHKGRQHLAARVIGTDEHVPDGAIVHRIRWYRRDRASAGVKARGRR